MALQAAGWLGGWVGGRVDWVGFLVVFHGSCFVFRTSVGITCWLPASMWFPPGFCTVLAGSLRGPLGHQLGPRWVRSALRELLLPVPPAPQPAVQTKAWLSIVNPISPTFVVCFGACCALWACMFQAHVCSCYPCCPHMRGLPAKEMTFCTLHRVRACVGWQLSSRSARTSGIVCTHLNNNSVQPPPFPRRGGR